MLRRKNINLIPVTKAVEVVVNVMAEDRNVPMVWNELCLGAEKMAADCGMEPSMTRLCVAQRHRINVLADT